MKNAWRANALVAIVSILSLVGCNSTQPDRIDTRTASVTFDTRADVDRWDCYDTPYVACFAANNGVKVERAVPWRYSLKITVIRAGSTQEELVTSLTGVLGSSVQPGDFVEDFVSLTEYDPDMPSAPDRFENGVTFTNGKMVSESSPIYLSTVGIDAGIPNILDTVPSAPNTPAAFEFSLNSGDTLIVQARKQPSAEAPRFSPPFENVRLSAALAISGVPVVMQGSQTSSIDDQAGFTSSFTVR